MVWRRMGDGVHCKASVAEIEQPVRILQFMFGQPVRISLEQQREVVEFILQLAVAGQAGGEGAEFGRV